MNFTAQALILKDGTTIGAEFATNPDNPDDCGAAALRALEKAAAWQADTVLLNKGEYRANQWQLPAGITLKGVSMLDTKLVGTYFIGSGLSTRCCFELAHGSRLEQLTLKAESGKQSMCVGHAPGGADGNVRRHSFLKDVHVYAEAWGVYSWPGDIQGQTIECEDVTCFAGRQCFTNGSSGARGNTMKLTRCTGIIEPARYTGGHLVQEGLFPVVARGGLTKLDGCTLRVPSAKDLPPYKMNSSTPAVPVRCEGIATRYGDSNSSGSLVVEYANTRFMVADDGLDVGWDSGTVKDLGGNRGSGVRVGGRRVSN